MYIFVRSILAEILSGHRKIATSYEERPVHYVVLEDLTKMKVVRHLIATPKIFLPGSNAQGLARYSQKTK